MTEPTEPPVPRPIERPAPRTSGQAIPAITQQQADPASRTVDSGAADSDVRREHARPASRPSLPAPHEDPDSTACWQWTPRFVVPAVFAVLLVLVQIGYPLSSGIDRDRVTVVVVMFSAGTALVHAGATRGIRYAVGFLMIVSGLGLLAEIIGTATGFPFGCYDYADGGLGPAVAGVPLVVALAWTGGLYPVWVVAGMLTRRVVGRVLMTAVGAVGWDLFLDPQMVADRQWSWCAAGWGLPGLREIPYTNYLGWFAVAVVMAALLTGLDRVAGTRAVGARSAGRRVSSAEPTGGGTSTVESGTGARELGTSALESIAPASEEQSRGPGPWIPAGVLVPVAVFLWTWLGSTLAHAVFLHLPYSAWYGCVGLGMLGVPLLVRLVRARGSETVRTPFVRYFGRRAFRPSRGNPGRRPGTM